MKNILIRAVFALTLLVTLGAVFGGVNSSLVHATPVPSTHMLSSVKPNIDRVPCNGPEFFEVFNNTGELCFANRGYVQVYIDQITAVCPGNNAGYFIDNGGNLYGFQKGNIDGKRCETYDHLIMTAINID